MQYICNNDDNIMLRLYSMIEACPSKWLFEKELACCLYEEAHNLEKLLDGAIMGTDGTIKEMISDIKQLADKFGVDENNFDKTKRELDEQKAWALKKVMAETHDFVNRWKH